METKIKISVILGFTLAVVLTSLIPVSFASFPGSPNFQLESGVLPQDVECNEGKVLFFKIKNNLPVCINETSIEKLDNSWIGWNNPHSPHFMRLFDAEYLFQKNNLLDRHVTVVYSIDEQNNDIVYTIHEEVKKTTDDFLIYNLIDKHKKIPYKTTKDLFSRTFGFSIVSNDGLDPVAWSDPRTSIKNVPGTIEDYGKLLQGRCNSNDYIGKPGSIYEESSFKIFDKFEIVTIQYDEQVVIKNYLDNADYTFNDLFLSQGKTEFIFQNDLMQIDITEHNCMLGHKTPYFVYQISFEVKNE